MHKIFGKKFLISLIFVTTSVGIGAQGTMQYRSPDDVDLPPIEQRKIIGTWLTSSLSGSCTRSFEGVNRKVYKVVRCSDGSGGNTGQIISQVSSTKFMSSKRSHGDHYVILANGNLSVRDRDGEIEVEPKHVGLWPGTQSKVTRSAKAEDAKTLGLNCYDVGYRYGHTATRSMKGKKVDPSWDFATPERCRQNPETDKGIQAGTRAAW